MQAHHPADCGVRPRRVCEAAQAEPVSGRQFLCLACRSRAIICRCCDRGQVYCGAECAGQARQQKQHAAAMRYAGSPRGKRRHADRSRRYRGRQREIVTHQKLWGDRRKVWHHRWWMKLMDDPHDPS